MENNNQNNSQELRNEGISFVELFNLVKKNIILIIIITFIATVIGGVYGAFIKKPVYSANATAVIQVDNKEIQEYNAFVYAQYLVNTMSEFIVSDSVIIEVGKELIQDEYQFEEKTNSNGEVVYFSEIKQKEYSKAEYDKIVFAKASSVKSGTKVTYNDESLILNISYSKEEVDETTPDEVVKTVKLLVEKTKEVALTLRKPLLPNKFSKGIDVKSVTYAYEQVYTKTTDAEGNVIYVYGEEKLSQTQYEAVIIDAVSALRENFYMYHDGTSLVLSIKSTEDSYALDPKIITYCLDYLNDIIKDLKPEDYADEYLYPNFANKLVEMNQPTFANKSNKTVIITIIAFIIGVAISCGIILVRYLLDDTFKSRSELEELTGTNVLTSIPRFNVKEDE